MNPEEALKLHRLWTVLFNEIGTPTPCITQFFVWLSKYPAELVAEALQSTLRKAYCMSQNSDTMSFAYQVCYCSKVLKLKTQDQIKDEMSRFMALDKTAFNSRGNIRALKKSVVQNGMARFG